MNRIEELLRDLQMVLNGHSGHVHINADRARPLLNEIVQLAEREESFKNKLAEIHSIVNIPAIRS